MVNIKNQIWSPDTCGCVIEEAFDYDMPQEKMLPTMIMAHKKCDEHAHYTDNLAHYTDVRKKNRTKNYLKARPTEDPDKVKKDASEHTDAELKDHAKRIEAFYNHVISQNHVNS